MPAVDGRGEQQTHFIDEAGLEERAVDVAAALEQQPADSELLPEEVLALDQAREIFDAKIVEVTKNVPA